MRSQIIVLLSKWRTMSDMEVDTRILVPMHNGLLCMPR